MSDQDSTRPALLALAAWTELEATSGRIVAATMRDDGPEVERLLKLAHELLDHHVNLKIASVAAMRERVRRQMDRF